MLNKWKYPYFPLLHLNLNAVMWKINSIILALWGASRKPSWLVMQIKELRGFHCTTHFPQNFAFLPTLEFSCFTVGYSPAVEQAEPWHTICSNLGPGFQVQWSSKISGGGNGKLQVSLSHHQRCCGHRSHWEMFSHLKMPIFLCCIAQVFVCLFRTDFGLTRSICSFIDFIIVPRDPQVPWGLGAWAKWESSLLLHQGTKLFPVAEGGAEQDCEGREDKWTVKFICPALQLVWSSCARAREPLHSGKPYQCTGGNMSSPLVQSFGWTWLWRSSSLCFPSYNRGRNPGYA